MRNKKSEAAYQKLIQKIRNNVLGIIMGFIFSGSISLVIWSFAYFGYINLGLPERYDYEKINHTIEKELPPKYTYRSIPIENFRHPDTKSILIIATHEDFGGSKFNQDIGSDILFLLDKTEREYKVTYKFQPEKKYPMHVRNIDVKDISGDKRAEILIGWSELGVHWSDTFLSVFKGEGQNITVSGSPKLSNFEYSLNDTGDKIINKFDKSVEVTSYRSEYFVPKEGMIAIINRNHDSCNACGDEDIWHINYLSYWDGNLVESGITHSNVRGFEKISQLLKEEGYDWQ